MKYIIVILSILSLYLFLSFIKLDINFINWPKQLRLGFMGTSFIIYITIIFKLDS